MLLTDINVLVHAYRKDAADHRLFRAWLEDLINGPEAFGVSEIVLSGFLRIVTHTAIFKTPSTLSDALVFAEQLRGQSNSVSIAPGSRHWEIFVDLCQVTNARGKLIPDAYLAALAIESGSEWISMDGDFARFAGLRWRRPFS